MTLAAHWTDGTTFAVASTKGWSDFTAWVETLPPTEGDELLHLTREGWTEDAIAAIDELEHALKSNPPLYVTVKHTAVELLSNLQGRTSDDVLVISDGVGQE